MAAQLHYSFAWALEIDGPATVRVATTDLMEAAAVTALGGFFKKGIKNGGDVRIVDGLPSLFYGVRHRSTFQLIVSNTDGDIDPSQDWRGAPYTLWHYDRNLGTATEDSVGIVTDAQFANGQVVFTFGVDESMLQQLLPAATIDPAVSSPFETSDSPGVAIPVVFGSSVPVVPPNLAADVGGDGNTSGYDYGVGYGNDLRIVAAYGDWDADRTGLERYGVFGTAPGSPAYLTGDPEAGTRFRVTGNQSRRYVVGQPIRFKTTFSGSAYVYTAIKAYHDDTDGGHQVEIYDDAIDSGLTGVQIGGDYAILRDVYTGVTSGLLPVPATGVNITAVRLFGQEDTTLLVLADNPTYPSGSGGTLPSAIIQAIITNQVWGCSSRTLYAVDGTSFSASAVAMGLAGLGGTVQGALAYSGQQAPAEDVLDSLLLIGRSRLSMNDRNQWAIATDVETLTVADFHFGPGLESGIRIKRVLAYGRAPLDRAVRNVILHWMPLGRVQRRASQFTQRGYARYSTKAVSGHGQDRHYYNPFIRSEGAAELVLQYLGEMLAGADEQLVFLAGPEARTIAPGDAITAQSTVDGFSGQWKVTESAKSLTDVQLTCIRYNAEAYATPSGIVHSAEPSDEPNTRTPPGPGPNLLPNPDFAPSLRTQTNSDWAQFNDHPYPGGPFFGVVTAATAPSVYPPRVPNKWWVSTDYNGYGLLSEFEVDKSVAVKSRTKGGHYIRMTFDSVFPSAPYPPAGGAATFYGDGLFTDDFAVYPNTDHIISFYGDATEGWYVVMYEDDHPDFHGTLVPLVQDATDTDGNGWTRFYGRWRAQVSTTTRVIMGICVSQAGTYNISSVQVEPVTGSARRPSEWKRNQETATVAHRFATITLDGSSSYTAPLIRAGDYVLGVSARITDPITYGTATQWELGTENNPDVWARNITSTFTTTDSSNFRDGSVAFFSAVDQDVVLSFLQADGTTAGTATTGTFSLVYSYTRSAPTPEY